MFRAVLSTITQGSNCFGCSFQCKNRQQVASDLHGTSISTASSFMKQSWDQRFAEDNTGSANCLRFVSHTPYSNHQQPAVMHQMLPTLLKVTKRSRNLGGEIMREHGQKHQRATLTEDTQPHLRNQNTHQAQTTLKKRSTSKEHLQLWSKGLVNQ